MNWKTYGIIAASVLFLFIILFRIVKIRRNRKEMRQQAENKLREEALDRVLIGAKSASSNNSPGPVPFDVRYNSDPKRRRKKASRPTQDSELRSAVMIELIEQTELSTRKYMFHVKDRITFGNRTAQNDIIVFGPRIAKRQCEIFRMGRELYIKSEAEGTPVILKRKNRQTTVGAEAIKLSGKDELLIGDSAYILEILKN